MATKTKPQKTVTPCVAGKAHRRPIVQVEDGYVGKCIHCGDEKSYTGKPPTVEQYVDFNRGPRSGK